MFSLDMPSFQTPARRHGQCDVTVLKTLAALPARRESGPVDPAALSPAARPHRLWSLDVLRGGCALAVFLCHWHLWSDFAPRGGFERLVRAVGEYCYEAFTTLTWPTGGHHPAVICFFVLSGFCIHYPFAQRALAGLPFPGWKEYFSRRFLRIMPVFWAACLFGLIFVIAESCHATGDPLLATHAAASPGEIIVRFAAMAGLYPREIFAGNYPLITVAVEIVMYALYPLVHYQAVRGRWLGLGLAFAVMQLIAIWLLQFVSPYWVFNSVLMFGLFWYAGALAAHLYVTRRTSVRGIWFVAVWLAYLAVKATPHFYGLTLLKQAVWALVCTFGLLWALRRESLHPAARDRPVVVAMRYSGKISYSLYAMHTPAIMLTTWGLLVFTSNRDYLMQLAATLAATAALTLLAYYGVERVFYRPRA
jgi:peptidoglycan/LPS O-acetylase OafA/YrhL